MLIHGRLILTASGLLLDEVRSLLQKSLRRKDRDLATRATRELIGRGKDQLPWKAIVTFLFEDHCLNNEQLLRRMSRLFLTKDKYGCISLLLESYGTCRIAACLPVIALDPQYEPSDWDASLTIDDDLRGLVSKQPSRIDFDLLLQHLRDAWKANDVTKIVTYVKMATMVVDHDARDVTKKGSAFCLVPVKTKHVGAVVLSMLSKTSREMKNSALADYTRMCCYFSTIADAPVRLILSAAAVQCIHADWVRHTTGSDSGSSVAWTKVPKLDKIPSWAVDKHTFRGKYGKGTTHILKTTDAKKLSEAELEEFHGPRPKHDIEHFFTEGVKCEDEVVEVNPYWERCKELYLTRPKKLQKTVRMTAVYYTELLEKYPGLQGPDAAKATGGQKRKSEELKKESDDRLTRKRVRVEAKRSENNTTTKVAKAENDTKISDVLQDIETQEEPCTDGPLLQLPTGSGKVYTRLDINKRAVWKGPYKRERIRLVLFFHRAMKEVFSDPHTLDIQRNGDYLKFPLVCDDANASLKITKKSFYDCISKKDVPDGEFVSREDLGIEQLHKISGAKIGRLPASLWCHFLFRFLLNIGDSGLYNSITDGNLSFLYGIDMEEHRQSVKGGALLDLMFTKLPKKDFCAIIKARLMSSRKELEAIMKADFDLVRLQNLAEFYDVQVDVKVIEGRLDQVKNILKR